MMTSAFMGFIVTRTLPATYVYGIYRHAHSARHIRIWDLSSRALCPPRTYMGFIVTRTLPATYVYGIYRHAPSYWNDSMRFRIIVYTPVTMATGSIYVYICQDGGAVGFVDFTKLSFALSSFSQPFDQMGSIP